MTEGESPGGPPKTVEISLNVNGQLLRLEIDSRMSILDWRPASASAGRWAGLERR